MNKLYIFLEEAIIRNLYLLIFSFKSFRTIQIRCRIHVTFATYVTENESIFCHNERQSRMNEFVFLASDLHLNLKNSRHLDGR